VTVLVDTSVWSLVLRRRASRRFAPKQRRAVESMRELIEEGGAALIGPIRQEILSGIRDERQFDRLREVLSNFPHIVIQEIDYDHAAECFNLCRAAGVAGTHVDMLICAVAIRVNVAIFTLDADFQRYAAVLGAGLFMAQ